MQWYDKGMMLDGVVTCLEDEHKWPIRVVNDEIVYRDEGILAQEMGQISANVEDGVKQDIEEAARCQIAGLYKAAVVMCRRVIQLALESRLPEATGKTLGPILDLEAQMTAPVLDAQTRVLAQGVKSFGDQGAHKKEDIAPDQSRATILQTVRVLNKIYG